MVEAGRTAVTQDGAVANAPTAYAARSLQVLENALAQLPAYAAWRARDPGPSTPVDTRYARLPALSREDIRAHFPDGFLPPGRDVGIALERGEVEYVTTSGTTGDRLINLWHQPWWNASEHASWRLNAHAARCALGEHREAILTSPLSTGVYAFDREVPMEDRVDGRFLFLNERLDPAEWTPAYVARMADELARFRPAVLEANPSLLARFARALTTQGRSVFQPDLVVLTFELPSRLHLRAIRRVFRAPVCSSYGSTECGYVFMECEAGRLHQNTEFCRVDVQPWVARHGGPALGRILVTTFGNPWFVLLRFDIGDIVRVAADACPCGRREGLTLAAVEGRAKDVTLTTGGTAVTVNRLDAALAAVPGVFTYQVEQTHADAFRATVVPDEDGDAACAPPVRAALERLYGPGARVEVAVERTVAPEASGKFRLAKPSIAVDPETFVDASRQDWGGAGSGGV